MVLLLKNILKISLIGVFSNIKHKITQISASAIQQNCYLQIILRVCGKRKGKCIMYHTI